MDNIIPKDILQRIRRDGILHNDVDVLIRKAREDGYEYFGRKRVRRNKDIEAKMLYKSISEAIEFLKTLNPDYILTKIWTGYEDCYVAVEYWDNETDDEYIHRLYSEVMYPYDAELEKRKKELHSLKEKKSKIEEEIRKLNK